MNNESENVKNITQNDRTIIELACQVVGTTKLAKIMQEKGADVSPEAMNRYKLGQRVRKTGLSDIVLITCRKELKKKHEEISEALRGDEGARKS